MSDLLSLTSAQLKRAAAIKDKINVWQKQLASILGAASTASVVAPVTKKRRKLSAAARAKIVAAQKARWAKVKSPVAKPVVKKKSTMSVAGRARIAAAAKARWAKAKAAGKTKL